MMPSMILSAHAMTRGVETTRMQLYHRVKTYDVRTFPLATGNGLSIRLG